MQKVKADTDHQLPPVSTVLHSRLHLNAEVKDTSRSSVSTGVNWFQCRLGISKCRLAEFLSVGMAFGKQCHNLMQLAIGHVTPNSMLKVGL